MKNNLLSIVIFISMTVSINAQNTTFNNVQIGLDDPTWGVNIKTNFPGLNGNWSRGFFVSNETGAKHLFSIGANGSSINGVSSFASGFIGTDWENQFMSFLANGNVGIGTTIPNGKLVVIGNSAVVSDFALYSGVTVNSILPNGKEPTLIIGEKEKGTVAPAVDGQVTYKGGISFGRGGAGIYSVNPNPAGSSYYGEMRFHTTYWNGSDYSNADRMVIKIDGNVGIGTINPVNKLDVNGIIHSKEVKVDMTGWPDFVFKKEYKLASLDEVERHINEKGHLENIPSEEEVLKGGLNLGDINAKLLQKMEEMTLYMIEQNKKMRSLEKEINILKTNK